MPRKQKPSGKNTNNSLSIEAGDYDTFNDVVMKVSYGYTNVVGLSEKDFEKLRNLL